MEYDDTTDLLLTCDHELEQLTVLDYLELIDEIQDAA